MSDVYTYYLCKTFLGKTERAVNSLISFLLFFFLSHFISFKVIMCFFLLLMLVLSPRKQGLMMHFVPFCVLST